MNGTSDSYTKLSRPETKRQIPYDITYLWNLKYGTDDPILKKQKQIMAKESRPGVPGGKGEGVGWTGTSGFLRANCYFWNGWAIGPYCTTQGNV